MLVRFFVILSISNFIYCQISPTLCSNYYDPTNLLLGDYCDFQSQTCNFTNGLKLLAVNQNYTFRYSLCLDLTSYKVSVQSDKKDIFVTGLLIEAAELHFQQDYSVECRQDIILKAKGKISMNSSTISSRVAWLQSPVIGLSTSKISNLSSLASTCNCIEVSKPCNEWTAYFPQLYRGNRYSFTDFNLSYLSWNINSVILAASIAIHIEATTLQSSLIAVYSPSISLQTAFLDTSGQGFLSDNGQGCGYYDQLLNDLLDCTGSGGSHGGFGGSSASQDCHSLMSQPPYDSIVSPYLPGSGGGFYLRQLSQFSSGGGVINIQTISITLKNTTVLASGLPGIQGGGGGAGGSISLDYFSISGQSSVINSNGGDAKSSGAGGRIRLWAHSWQDSPQNQNLKGIQVTSNGGINCIDAISCGQKGSIVVSPCLAGYTLSETEYSCTRCQKGFYQAMPGYGPCFPCGNKPANSVYNSNLSHTHASACIYACMEGYRLKDSLCLDELDYSLDGIGGLEMMICLLVLLLALIFYFFFICLKGREL